MVFNLLGVYLFVVIILSVFLASYIQGRGSSNYTKAMFLMTLAVCTYLFGYVMEVHSRSYEQIIFWNTFQYFGIPFVSTLWLTVALMYTGRFSLSKKWLLAYVYVIPLITFILRMTNSWHFLYIASMDVVERSSRLLLSKVYGPFTYVQAAHSLSMVLVSMVIFILEFIKSKRTDEQNEVKILLMICASLFAVLGIVLNMTNPWGVTIDYMVLCLPITGAIVMLSIIRYDFLEIKTLARQVVFESSADAMLLVNSRGHIVDYNPKMESFINSIGIEFKVDTLDELLKDDTRLKDIYKKEGISTFEIMSQNETHYYKLKSAVVKNNFSGNFGYLKTITDITKSYKLQEELRRQAETDVLSGLANRRSFMRFGKEIFRKCLEEKKALFVLMLDLDHFKQINDKYGHQVGDEVIQIFGHMIKRNFRENDLVARLGGEEFAVALAGISESEAVRKADELREKVARRRRLEDDSSISFTVSIGISELTPSTNNLDQLLNQADQALYDAKETGRNKTVLYKKMK